MNKYLSKRHAALKPYTPGEQPRGEVVIKLNTNESPFPPPQSVIDAITGAAPRLQLYSDPQGTELKAALAAHHGVSPSNITLGNGSDEPLAFAFNAFGDAEHPFAFPDITYGFYPVFAASCGVPTKVIPLNNKFEIVVEDYLKVGYNIAIANPNAPTGITLPLTEIERIVASNPDNVVIIDEAYVDFGGETAMPLVAKYDNLLVVRTFSKSYNLAGARLGYAVGSEELIGAIETIRNSFNPYNVNSLTLAAGVAALKETAYYEECWKEIIKVRESLIGMMRVKGFLVTDSKANFIFARLPEMSGVELQKALREHGFLVRNLGPERIRDWLRITIGTLPDISAMFNATGSILNNYYREARK